MSFGVFWSPFNPLSGLVQIAAEDLKPPSDWMWERFQLVRTEYQVPKTYEPKLVPGLVVGLHNTHFWRFLRLRDNADMDASDVNGPDDLKKNTWWTWERYADLPADLRRSH